MTVPRIGIDPLIHQDFILFPDAVPTITGRGAVHAGADPLNLVVPDLARAAGNLAVHLIVGPCAGTCFRSGVSIACIPCGVPLHDHLVIGVGGRPAVGSLASRDTPRTVGAVENAGAVVVAILVEPAVRGSSVRQCARGAAHAQAGHGWNEILGGSGQAAVACGEHERKDEQNTFHDHSHVMGEPGRDVGGQAELEGSIAHESNWNARSTGADGVSLRRIIRCVLCQVSAWDVDFISPARAAMFDLR
jgi:hypothetical protein